MNARIEVESIAFDGNSPLLELLPDNSPLAWVRNGQGVIGYGEFARATFKGRQRFEDANQWWREQLKGFRIQIGRAHV